MKLIPVTFGFTYYIMVFSLNISLLLLNNGITLKICDFGTARDKQTLMSTSRVY